MRVCVNPLRLQLSRRVINEALSFDLCSSGHRGSERFGYAIIVATPIRMYSTGASHIPYEASARWSAAGEGQEEEKEGNGSSAASRSSEESADYRRQQAARDGFQSSFRHERWERQRETQEDWGEGATARDSDHHHHSNGSNSSSGASTSDPNSARRASPHERRQISHKWENAFFGRVHFEPGMHDRFESVMSAEEESRGAADRDASDGTSSSSSSSSSDVTFPWPEDEEAPIAELRKLSDGEVKRYIVQRLIRGERRIRFAPDYGSLVMMQYLNMGEMMINEAEKLLDAFGWMNEDVFHRIEEVKAEAKRIKYDFDLD